MVDNRDNTIIGPVAPPAAGPQGSGSRTRWVGQRKACAEIEIEALAKAWREALGLPPGLPTVTTTSTPSLPVLFSFVFCLLSFTLSLLFVSQIFLAAFTCTVCTVESEQAELINLQSIAAAAFWFCKIWEMMAGVSCTSTP